MGMGLGVLDDIKEEMEERGVVDGPGGMFEDGGFGGELADLLGLSGEWVG